MDHFEGLCPFARVSRRHRSAHLCPNVPLHEAPLVLGFLAQVSEHVVKHGLLLFLEAFLRLRPAGKHGRFELLTNHLQLQQGSFRAARLGLGDLVALAHHLVVQQWVVDELLHLLDEQSVLLLFRKGGIFSVYEILLPFEVGLHAFIFNVVVVFVFCLFLGFDRFIPLLAEARDDFLGLGLLLVEAAAHTLDSLLQDRFSLAVFLRELGGELLDCGEVSLLQLAVKILYFVGVTVALHLSEQLHFPTVEPLLQLTAVFGEDGALSW